MHPVAIAALSVAPLLLSVGILWSLITWREREIRNRTRRNPLSRNLLRGPGHSLREALDELTTDLMGYVAILILIGPAVANLLYATWLVTGTLRWSAIVIGVVAFVAASTWVALRIRHFWQEGLKIRLGLDAEESMGQELNNLMPFGFRVFHDIPCTDFNIDHVVVGESGLFVVETKGRSKASENSEVVFDGQRLQFPSWQESAPVRQAIACARWAEDWVSSAIAEKVQATPVLAIPGWYINRTLQDVSVVTVNGKHMLGAFRKLGRQSLSPATVQRIAHQLEERCRTVEPRAYRREPQSKSKFSSRG